MVTYCLMETSMNAGYVEQKTSEKNQLLNLIAALIPIKELSRTYFDRR